MPTVHQPTAERSLDPSGALVNVLPIAHRAGVLLDSADPVYVPFHAFTACCDRADARSSHRATKKGSGLWQDLQRYRVTV